MGISPQALALEESAIGRDGKPVLGDVYELLRQQWRQGDRDRELGLHLMFIAWYLGIEPPFLTGLDATRTPSSELPTVFAEVHDYFLDSIEQDPEMLYSVGLMARLCPWCLGEIELWEQRSERYRQAYRQQMPNGIPPSTFDDRGFYGHYFAGQARVRDGY